MEVRELAYDSRLVHPGAVFVAVPSVTGGPDGDQFIGQATDRGAVAIVAPLGTADTGVPTICVSNPREALGDLAAAFFGHPSCHLRLYGVTGTDGKTTTTYLLEQILAGCGRRTGLVGTVETKIGDVRRSSRDRMTTPESLDVQRLLREMVDAGVTDVAMEVSSHALALDRVRACHFEAVGLTNITADHIEFHGSRSAYVAAKQSLFSQYAAGRPAVLNRDDPSFNDSIGTVSGPLLSYGLHDNATLQAQNIRPDPTSTGIDIAYQGKRAHTRVPLPADFNVLNALAALGLALMSGIALGDAADALRRAGPPPGRLQPVDCGQPFTVLIDYAHTPNAFRSVLEGLGRDRRGKLIAVFGAAGNRDHAKRPLLAQIALANADFFYITNEDPFDEDAGAIMREIAAGISPTELGIRYALEPDREQAIAQALDRARPGDIVVVTGKGHERSIVEQGRIIAWNDVEIVQRLLEARA